MVMMAVDDDGQGCGFSASALSLQPKESDSTDDTLTDVGIVYFIDASTSMSKCVCLFYSAIFPHRSP
jgi:hypothetical protein